jgi:pyrimidine oxygenase
MTRPIDLGVFLPVANNGWIISTTSPQYLPTFALNRDISVLAERIGFNYVFSMAKWRGFGGATEFWKYSLESTMLMAGLAGYVPRVRLIASVAPALIHPAVFAKMAATTDDITGGRLGINIVSAGNPGEYTQMGLYPENFESFRYDYTEEWLEIVKRLWTEDSVTFKGQYFTLEACESFPKPVQSTVPIVCATSSERGYRFVAVRCTDAFFGGGDLAAQKARSRRIKEVAATYGRPVRTHTQTIVILAETDAEARRMYDHYLAGADRVAIDTIFRTGAGEKYEGPDTRLFYGGAPVVGGPEHAADAIEEIAGDGGIDGILFCFPDFIEGLTLFGEHVMPILRRRGLVADVPPSVGSPA